MMPTTSSPSATRSDPNLNEVDADNAVKEDMIKAVDPDNAPA